jgi:hypothetical protein
MAEPGNKTVRAPLFSEQVALIAHLDEASAGQLRTALDRAQQGGKSGKNDAPTLRTVGAVVGFFGVAAAAVGTLVAVQQNVAIIAAGLGLSTVGMIMLLLAVQAEALHSAALVKALAQSIAKRKKEATHPGAPNPLK